jgi:hypothetical protein
MSRPDFSGNTENLSETKCRKGFNLKLNPHTQISTNFQPSFPSKHTKGASEMNVHQEKAFHMHPLGANKALLLFMFVFGAVSCSLISVGNGEKNIIFFHNLNETA